jgi:hypothetical protein
MTNIAMDQEFENEAMQNIADLCALGPEIILKKSGTKDKFGEPTGSETLLRIRAYPVRFTPFSRKMSEKIAWSTGMDVIFYIPKKTIDAFSYNIDDLKSFKTVTIGIKTFDIQNIDYHMNVSGQFLYYVIGGVKA